MKKICITCLLLAVVGVGAFAQSPKREIRSSWLATVWRIDWPNSTIPVFTGSNEAARQDSIASQKRSLVAIFDNLAAANYNAVFFQVRSMCDAMYKSSYEPWSQWVSAERGSDPGWDPLSFAIEEAHKRGMELHAWVNPYRYSTNAEVHGDLLTDYAWDGRGLLLDYGSYNKILNPGLPEVRKLIADIVEEIITNYDVDGIVFDDYFYMQRTMVGTGDQAQFDLYNPNNLLRADWRRDNVNKMIADVYNRIQSIDPSITFGVSPAGGAASNKAVSDKYGLEEPCPAHDWQYDGIYSDPLAWLLEGTLDYMSPQIYWSGDSYTNPCRWWSKVCRQFGKHFYSSHEVTNLLPQEIGRQVGCNRDFDLNDAPGNVFFSNVTAIKAENTEYLKNNQFRYKSIAPSISWKPASMQGMVENMALSGQTLSWNYGDNKVRYAVYAVPNEYKDDPQAFASSRYLQGISYSKQFTLPDNVGASSHRIAVSVLDRYGNEFSPRALNESLATPEAARLIYPADNAPTVTPVLFTWEPVPGAGNYVWQLSRDAGFNDLIVSRETVEPQFNSAYLTNLKNDTRYYWRVRTIKPNAGDTWSETRSFVSDAFRIHSPNQGETNVSLAPTVTWSEMSVATDYTLEISTSNSFSNLFYSATVQTNSHTIPEKTLLTGSTYYARVSTSTGSMTVVSPVVSFTVIELDIPAPVIISPVNASEVSGTSLVVSWVEQMSRGFRVELATSASFPPLTTQIKSVGAYEYSVQYDNLQPRDYYIRVVAQRLGGLSPYSETVQITMNTTGIGEIAFQALNAYVTNGNLIVQSEHPESLAVAIYDLTGQLLSVSDHALQAGDNTIPLNAIGLRKGVYLIRLQTAERSWTLKTWL